MGTYKPLRAASHGLSCFLSYKTSSALNRRTELYLKEHEHIRGSDALADEAIRYVL